MYLEKLPWAGVLVKSGDTTLVIDPLGDTTPPEDPAGRALLGKSAEPFIPLSELPPADAVLITHVHPDHFHPESIFAAYGKGIPLLLPVESVSTAEKAGFTNAIGMSVGSSSRHGSVTVTATHSVDGFGTPQVAWIVEAEGRKIMHCGDTLWHGYWWKIARLYGPIDVACLPINAPILEVPGLPKQSSLPAAMSPEEAVEAAFLLGVKKLVPIHFDTFNHPPHYIQTPDALQRLLAKARERSVEVEVLGTREVLDLSLL
jgi:L-ascorbate metabolism protein UlaG (beta-lactamase superfamily)